MNIEIENQMSIDAQSMDIKVQYSNEEITIEQENLDLEISIPEEHIEFESDIQTIYEKDHANLDNLDYEHSGHTGFQKAGNYVEDENYTHTDNNYTNEDKQKLNGIEARANYYVLPGDVVRDKNYIHIDNNFTDKEKTKLSGIEDGANNYILPSNVVKDSKYIHTDNNFTDDDKNKLKSIEKNANHYVLPNDVIRDLNYIHTDNNYTNEEKSKLDGIEKNANHYVLPSNVVQDSDYVHTDNNFTDSEREKLDSVEANANYYVLPSSVVQDKNYHHTDNNFTDSEKSKLEGIEAKANYYVLPGNVVKDINYVHTDNNYTTAEKNKLKGIEANANNFVLPSDVVQDSKYVHTDNNFTDEHKEKLDGLESLSGNASDITYEDTTGQGTHNVQDAMDEAFRQLEAGVKAIDIPYEDNYGYGGENVQDALDKAFAQIDNGYTAYDIGYEDNVGYEVDNVQDALDNALNKLDDFGQAIGDMSNLETEDTTNLVNAINSLVGQGGSGIPVLSGDINIYDLEQGIYLLSGANTRLLRSSYVFMSKPVLNDYSKSILIFIREAQYGEQGFILKASSASPYVQLYAFDRTNTKEYNAMQLISMYNSTAYNVTNTYQPAHKQYVDGQINMLRGELGGIVELGEIRMQEWDDSMDAFMGSLTDTGRYHFQDDWDYFDWYLEVIALGNRVGQWYWYTEEGYTVQYYRDGWLNGDDEWEWSDWQSDVTWETVQHQLNSLESNISNSYAPKTHTHLSAVSIASSLTFKEWLDNRRTKGYIQYIATSLSDNGKYIVTFHYNASVKNLSYVYYQEYFDLSEPSKIYKRIGTAPSSSNTATVTWQPWCVFEGKQVEE